VNTQTPTHQTMYRGTCKKDIQAKG
jgi:hypothetical protein